MVPEYENLYLARMSTTLLSKFFANDYLKLIILSEINCTIKYKKRAWWGGEEGDCPVSTKNWMSLSLLYSDCTYKTKDQYY